MRKKRKGRSSVGLSVGEALRSSTPAGSLLSMIPAGKRDEFFRFARLFGFTRERIQKLLDVERG